MALMPRALLSVHPRAHKRFAHRDEWEPACHLEQKRIVLCRGQPWVKGTGAKGLQAASVNEHGAAIQPPLENMPTCVRFFAQSVQQARARDESRCLVHQFDFAE